MRASSSAIFASIRATAASRSGLGDELRRERVAHRSHVRLGLLAVDASSDQLVDVFEGVDGQWRRLPHR
jgi:hypothetical protein